MHSVRWLETQSRGGGFVSTLQGFNASERLVVIDAQEFRGVDQHGIILPRSGELDDPGRDGRGPVNEKGGEQQRSEGISATVGAPTGSVGPAAFRAHV